MIEASTAPALTTGPVGRANLLRIGLFGVAGASVAKKWPKFQYI
jgi:hypothetical protein